MQTSRHALQGAWLEVEILGLPWRSSGRLRASNAGDTGLIPDRGTKIPHAAWCGQKKEKRIVNSVADVFL